MKIRAGLGFDVHRLVRGRELWLGGVKVPHTLGLLGHSDADVLIHALCDALLGAAGLRDIGYYFPDSDAAFKDIRSTILLERTLSLLKERGWSVGNADIVVMAQKPKLLPYIPQMRANLARLMEVEEADVCVKATTTEQLGFAGREEGIAAQAAVLICRN